MQIERFAAEQDDRLDRLLSDHLQHLSRSQLQRVIEAGHASVDGTEQTRPGHPVRAGAEIAIRLPTTPDLDALARDIPLDLIYEDEELLVINKPPGLLVHPVQGRPAVTLVHLVRAVVETVPGAARIGAVQPLACDLQVPMLVTLLHAPMLSTVG